MEPNNPPVITPEREEQLKILMERILNVVASRAGWGRSCLTCANFREQAGEVCALAGQRPPARVIVYGCPRHDRETPF